MSMKQHSQESEIFSQMSVNSSRFEEAKFARKERDNQILSKIANLQQRMQRNRELANECIKFRPIKKGCKEN